MPQLVLPFRHAVCGEIGLAGGEEIQGCPGHTPLGDGAQVIEDLCRKGDIRVKTQSAS